MSCWRPVPVLSWGEKILGWFGFVGWSGVMMVWSAWMPPVSLWWL